MGDESNRWLNAVSWGDQNLLAVYRTDGALWSVLRTAGEWKAAEEIGSSRETDITSLVKHALPINPLTGDALLIWYDATDVRFNLWEATSLSWKADQGERLSPEESGAKASEGWQAYADGVFVSVHPVEVDAAGTEQLLLRRIDHGMWMEPVKLPPEFPRTAKFVTNARGEGALVWSDPVGKRIIGRRLHADFTLADAVEVASASDVVDVQAIMLANGTVVVIVRSEKGSRDWQGWDLSRGGAAWKSTGIGPFAGIDPRLVQYTDNESAVVYSKNGSDRKKDKIWLTSRTSDSLAWAEPLLVAHDFFGRPNVLSDGQKNLLIKTSSTHGGDNFKSSRDHFWSLNTSHNLWQKGPQSLANTKLGTMLATSGLPMVLGSYRDDSDLPRVLSIERAWSGQPGSPCD